MELAELSSTYHRKDEGPLSGMTYLGSRCCTVGGNGSDSRLKIMRVVVKGNKSSIIEGQTLREYRCSAFLQEECTVKGKNVAGADLTSLQEHGFSNQKINGKTWKNKFNAQLTLNFCTTARHDKA